MAAHKYCEITKAISDLSSSSSSEDSDFEEILSNATSTGSQSTTGKQQKTTPRLPTRRPDPNVCNRNALLARENRRKKKEYVATLEKELDTMKSTNKKLNKLLRKQVKFVRRLENEKQYYKSLISNQSDILNLVTVLNTKTTPISSDASSCSPTDSNRSTSSLEPSSINYDFNDNDSSYEPYSESHWDQLLGMEDNTPLPEEDSGYYPIINSRCEVQSNISGEHNYFNNIEDDSGLCLHMARGKASDEYCPSCHTNAKRFPDQLLVVD